MDQFGALFLADTDMTFLEADLPALCNLYSANKLHLKLYIPRPIFNND